VSPVDPPPTGDNTALWVGRFALRPAARLLLAEGKPVRIGQRAFDLLCALAAPPQPRLPAERLRQQVWGDSKGDLSNLRVQVAALRRLLGPAAISFVATKGYRLELPVQPVDSAMPTSPASESTLATAPATPPPGQLPPERAPLMGRDETVQSLASQLGRQRLITLKGPGGAGKSAVALAAARCAAPGFRDGAWWIDLAPLASPALVLGAVASALGRALPETRPLDALVAMLAPQQPLLLVLDNCEHLLPAVVELCDALLRGAPQVHLLATSRVPLKAAGERLWPVGALALPQEASLQAARASGALALFEARARAADARFRLTPENLPAVLDICRSLDGLALALILAAATVPVLGVAGLQARLHDRLRWTQRAGPPGAARHLSLQNTLDWSHDLLGADEQQLLSALGVFAGSFALPAVLQVLEGDGLAPAAVVQALQGLVAHSLLGMDTASLLAGGGEDTSRYTLHEAVRLHARQRLGSGERAQRLHAAHADFFQAVGRRLSRTATRESGTQPVSHADLDNLRAAIAWSTEHRPEQAMAMCADCCFTWRKLGFHAEARRYVNRLLALPAQPHQAVARADLLVGLCGIDFELDALDQVMAGAEAALQWLQGQGEPARAAHARAWQAAVYLNRVELPQAESVYREVLHTCRQAGDALGVRDTLNNLGFTLLSQPGREAEARVHLQEAAALHTRHGDEWGLLLASENLGELELGLGLPAQAVPHHEAAVVAARRIRHLFRLAHNLLMLALARSRLGQGAAARACLHEALQISNRQSFQRLQADACALLAGALLDSGQPARALTLVHLARRLYPWRGLKPFPVIEAELQRTEPACLAALPAQAQHRLQHQALAQAATMTPEDAEAWAAG
jgi:predicted ATPase/DNA-binding winged helix-turn-helix (wHTH) protein